MFGFFVALFGGLFYGGKYLNEKEQKRCSQKREIEYYKIQKKIEMPLGSNDYPPPRTRDEFMAMANEISDDLIYIFGEDWKKKVFNYILITDYRGVCTTYEPRDMFYHEAQIVYEVWLSRKGVLRRGRHNCFRVNINGYINNDKARGYALRACEVIEKNLQSAHPDLILKLRTSPTSPYMLEWEHFQIDWNYGKPFGERLW